MWLKILLGSCKGEAEALMLDMCRQCKLLVQGKSAAYTNHPLFDFSILSSRTEHSCNSCWRVMDLCLQLSDFALQLSDATISRSPDPVLSHRISRRCTGWGTQLNRHAGTYC